MFNIFRHYRARRDLAALKADAAARLAVAEIKLATAIAERATAPVPFRRAYAAEIRARQFIRDRLMELAQ